VQAVAARDLDRSVEHQPGRDILFADGIDRLSRGEGAGGAAGKALCRCDLRGVENRVGLMLAGAGIGHRPFLVSGRKSDLMPERL
jgi:hypothetical protein